MKISKFFLLVFLIFGSIGLQAAEKDGKITGKVYDGSNGSVLPDAIIKIEGENKGAAADLDGKFEINSLKPGLYNVKISYVGYISKNYKVDIKGNDIVSLEVVLDPETTTTDTVTVEAVRTQNNEAGLLLKQQKSESITDGISEQQIKRAPDAVASDVLKRVIGVSIVNDKFVYVRGTSDRYSLTTLNGAIIPSTEPDKKAFSFDLFPSNLLENIIISKSYTPDQPGSYSGGLLQVSTKDFPEAFTFSYSITGGYNTGTTGKDFLTYTGGQSKILFFNSGFDDGLRSLPSIFPSQRLINSYYNQQQLKTFGRAFRNNWGQFNITAPMNAGFQLSVGNKFNVFKNPLGVLFAYSYKNSFSNSDLQRKQYNTDFSPLEEFNGNKSTYSVLGGGLLNLIYKIGDFNKIGVKTTYSVGSEDETSFLEGFKILSSEENDYRLYQTKFTERTLISTQVTGEHYFSSFAKMSLIWRGSYSESHRNEPDRKTMTYQRERNSGLPFFARLSPIPNGDAGDRFFSELKDINRNGTLDLSFPFFKMDGKSQSKLKLGVFASNTSRTFDARDFAPKNLGSFYIAFEGIDSIFRPENIDTNKIEYEETTREEDKYRAKDENYAGYLMFDVPLKKLRIIAGLRFEYNRQQVNTYGRIGELIKTDLKNNDILPSLNLTYALNDKMNIRASVSQTISRPELREISPYGYVDFSTGIKVTGNPKLERSLIQNYDLRYEFYPAAGEIVSLSLFYKNFENPIEQVYAPGQNNPEISFENAKNGAKNYGLEIEARKNLGFITRYLNDFSVNGNLALVDSRIDMEGLQSGATETTRRMQGQSPYTINLGLYYDNYDLGSSVNLVYNKFGKRVSEVGRNGFNDIYEIGNDVVDFTVAQKLFEYFELKFSAKDILNKDKIFEQKVGDELKIVRRISTGTNYSLTASYKF